MEKNNLLYTKTHEWVEMLDDTTAVIGLSNYAQNSLGDIVFVSIKECGEHVEAEESLADVESVKAVSEIISPFSGTIAEVNEVLLDSPEKINEDPYGAWICKMNGISNKAEMMSAEEYEEFIKNEEA